MGERSGCKRRSPFHVSRLSSSSSAQVRVRSDRHALLRLLSARPRRPWPRLPTMASNEILASRPRSPPSASVYTSSGWVSIRIALHLALRMDADFAVLCRTRPVDCWAVIRVHWKTTSLSGLDRVLRPCVPGPRSRTRRPCFEFLRSRLGERQIISRRALS